MKSEKTRKSQSNTIVQSDIILSFEVGEHIPQQHESTFFQHIHNNNRLGAIISWSVSDSFGHVNHQPNSYVIEKMQKLGYIWEEMLQRRLRDAAEAHWFKGTIMVFKRKKTT